ncbi:MAG: hydantoinase/oxoprolinase family protein [Chloroflexi bacterium]|nr:hydantoinase/oxoprolinase family protein [Chloroflexota bacterium]
MRFKIGIDVGGTFTDFLVTDQEGKASVHKTLTTPSDPSQGVLEGLSRAAQEQGFSLQTFLSFVETIVHGTTITTNATLTGTGAKTGFITTKGFRDVLNMRRGLRERQFDSRYNPPSPLVPRYLIQTVEERVDCDGVELVPLNEGDVYRAIDKLKSEEVQAVAVSFLFSFFNPSHEQRVRKILEQELPGVFVSLSSEILPQVRLYERNSTTALNAYVGPPLSRYLKEVQAKLQANSFRGTLLIMQSNGGVMAPEVARRFAANTLLSGPAGGPVAGIFYGQTHEFSDIMTIDMGGTSFDASLVKDKRPILTTEGEVGGYRVALPSIDIHTIGAGGGSIAWIDAGGLLRVGPRSAGAEPGPVCYDRGGTEPTVTDADLLLGYLDPDFFFGGEIRLNVPLTEKIVRDKIAQKLSMGVLEAAHGIFQVINSNMAAAMSVVSVQRGYDPREFALVVAGGAGPIHAGMIAKELNIPLIIVPRESSVFCAAGMLLSDLKHDFVRTYVADFDKLDLSRVNALHRDMGEEAMDTLMSEGIPADRIVLSSTADLRYVGQFNEVEVSLRGNGAIDTEGLRQLRASFHQRHDTLYGYSLPEAPTELINLRVTAQGITDKPSFEKRPFLREDPSPALKGTRKAFFLKEFVTTPVYDGLKMGYGNVVRGPAIVEQPTTTIIIDPAYDLTCDEYSNYILYPKGKDLSEITRRLKERD